MARGDNPGRDREEDERAEALAWDAIHGVDAMARRRDLMVHCPYGRALDVEHLAVLVESGNSQNHGLVMKDRLVAWAVQQLGGTLVLTGRELDELRAAQGDGHGNWPRPASIPEWPASR